MESSNPKQWGLTLNYYKEAKWGSLQNGKFKLPWSIKEQFMEIDDNNQEFFNEEKFYNNSIMTFINAFMYEKRQIFQFIRPWNLPDESLEQARQIINIAFEEAMLNNNLYQISKAQVFQSSLGSVNSQQTAWNDQLDLFGERSKSLMLLWGDDIEIIELEVDDASDLAESIKGYFQNSQGLLEPISVLGADDFPKGEPNE